MNGELLVYAPLHLLISRQVCWKCKTQQEVTALACHNFREDGSDFSEPGDTSEMFLLSAISEMPLAVLRFVTQRNPRYMQRHSRTAGTSYYANVCECGANFGDFYLFSEPGGAFFPMTDDDAKLIKLETLPFSGMFQFCADYHFGSVGPNILQFAHRIA